MIVPVPALAPETPEVAPTVQLKLLPATDEVNAILGELPVQTAVVLAVVTTGVGFTVTVMVYGAPVHEPPVAVGVTRYCTVPAVELPGLVNV